VGSYELLLWLIRTAAAGPVVREPTAVHYGEPADHPPAELRLVPVPDADAADDQEKPDQHVMFGGPDGLRLSRLAEVDRTSDPGRESVAQRDGKSEVKDIDGAAVAAYRASVDQGRPLSERKLAAMFGKTSRRWARNRMADAHQMALVAAISDKR
jgi:hypothetical protein